jgi:hypothetical protein
MGELRGLLLKVSGGLGVCVLAMTAVDRTLLHESFVPIPVDLAADRRVDAYVPYYRKMLPLVDPKNAFSAIDLRSLADEMILASQSGQLKPILVSFHGEELEDSPKGRLVSSTICIARQLTEVAVVELRNQRIDDAVADAIRASAVIETIRFASDESMMKSALVVRRAVEISSAKISEVKRLDPHLVRQLASNVSAQARFEEMERRSAQLKLMYSVRYGEDDAMESSIQRVGGPSQIRAQKFFGIDRENTLVAKAKACQFLPGSEVK